MDHLGSQLQIFCWWHGARSAPCRNHQWKDEGRSEYCSDLHWETQFFREIDWLNSHVIGSCWINMDQHGSSVYSIHFSIIWMRAAAKSSCCSFRGKHVLCLKDHHPFWVQSQSLPHRTLHASPNIAQRLIAMYPEKLWNWSNWWSKYVF